MRTESFPLVPALLAAGACWAINANYLIEIWGWGFAYVLETHRKIRRQYLWQNREEDAASVVLPRHRSWSWTLQGKKITVLVAKDRVTFFSWGTEILASRRVGMYQSAWSFCSAYLEIQTPHYSRVRNFHCNVKYSSWKNQVEVSHIWFLRINGCFVDLSITVPCLKTNFGRSPGAWSLDCRGLNFAQLPFLWRPGMVAKWHTRNTKATVVTELQKTYCEGFWGKKKYHNNVIPRLEDLGKWFIQQRWEWKLADEFLAYHYTWGTRV